LRPKFTPHTKKPELVQQPDFRKPPGSDEKAQKQQLLEGPEELSKLPKPALPVAFGTPNQPGPAIGSVTSSNVSTTAHGSLEIKNVGAPASLPSPVLILPGSVHTICNYEGIKVQVVSHFNKDAYSV
jgi:hypothetical protein